MATGTASDALYNATVLVKLINDHRGSGCTATLAFGCMMQKGDIEQVRDFLRHSEPREALLVTHSAHFASAIAKQFNVRTTTLEDVKQYNHRPFGAPCGRIPIVLDNEVVRRVVEDLGEHISLNAGKAEELQNLQLMLRRVAAVEDPEKAQLMIRSLVAGLTL